MRHAGAAATIAITSAPRTWVARPEHPVVEGLLHFPFQPRQLREVALEPVPPAEPSSIKDAIIRWLDEQL